MEVMNQKRITHINSNRCQEVEEEDNSNLTLLMNQTDSVATESLAEMSQYLDRESKLEITADPQLISHQ
jgi:hypothetical protein